MCATVGGPLCNKEVLDKLKAMEQNAVEIPANDIWQGLEQFKKTKSKKQQ